MAFTCATQTIPGYPGMGGHADELQITIRDLDPMLPPRMRAERDPEMTRCLRFCTTTLVNKALQTEASSGSIYTKFHA